MAPYAILAQDPAGAFLDSPTHRTLRVSHMFAIGVWFTCVEGAPEGHVQGRPWGRFPHVFHTTGRKAAVERGGLFGNPSNVFDVCWGLDWHSPLTSTSTEHDGSSAGLHVVPIRCRRLNE